MAKYTKKINGVATNSVVATSYSIDVNTYEYEVSSNAVSVSIGNTGATINHTINATYVLTGMPRAFINGRKFIIGVNATPSNNQCFLSPDGSTVRVLATIQNGDKLYWNPAYTDSFDLDTNDSIILEYTIKNT